MEKSIFTIFKKGNVLTKLSFLIMGISNIYNKQVLKGLLFLFYEIAFIFFMCTTGSENLIGFFTLGTKTQGWKYNKSLGINVMTPGDNSMLFLIHGLISLLIILLFVFVYRSSVKSAYKLQVLQSEKKTIPTLAQDLSSLVNEKFHMTLLTIPVIGIVTFTIMPLIFMILIAFTNFDSAHQPPAHLFNWVFLENFKNMFHMGSKLSKTFVPVLGWTFIWAIFATGLNYILGIVVALLINKKGIRLKPMWRTIFILTIAIPQFVSLLVMRNMLSEFGPINSFLQNVGLISKPLPFLTDPLWAKISVIIVNLWVGIPYTLLITSGVLMNIPNDLYESARIDGASTFTMFRKITMPYIFFVTAPYLITQFIGNLNNFNVIYLLTRGEPLTSEYYCAGKTDLLITWLYKLTVERKDYSIASTIGICVFVISVVFSLLAYRRTAAYSKEEDFV